MKGEKVVDQIDFTVGSRGPERTCSVGGVAEEIPTCWSPVASLLQVARPLHLRPASCALACFLHSSGQHPCCCCSNLQPEVDRHLRALRPAPVVSRKGALPSPLPPAGPCRLTTRCAAAVRAATKLLLVRVGMELDLSKSNGSRTGGEEQRRAGVGGARRLEEEEVVGLGVELPNRGQLGFSPMRDVSASYTRDTRYNHPTS
jgi:hypothetical protein